MNLIICETEARMRAVADVATVLDEPYVPFRMLFVEGVMEADFECGDKHIIDVPMMSAALLLGDHNNVFFLRKICSKDGVSSYSLHDIHTSSNVFVNTPAPIMSAMLSDVSSGEYVQLLDRGYFHDSISWSDLAPNADEDSIQQGFRENGYGLNLKVGLGSSQDIKSVVIDSCLHETDMFNVSTVYLPGLDIDSTKFDRQSALAELQPLRVKELKEKLDDHGVDWKGMIEKGEMFKAICDAMETQFAKNKEGQYDNEMKNGTSLFHRNGKGEDVFSKKEAERASDFIASLDIERRVKAALQKKRFVLPQQTDKVQAHFCNESVYGTLNILWVCGVIRMESGQSENMEVGSTKESEEAFDAWPSKEAQANSDNNRERLERLIQENDGPYWDWPGYTG